METFDSTKSSLIDLLRDIESGKIQLPDFQRGWVWDDDHVKSLLVSIARSFPVGAVMLMETGGEVRFQVRPIEGLEQKLQDTPPERLILDGQTPGWLIVKQSEGLDRFAEIAKRLESIS
jgi:uncharacterized protein with ParB-like and HNH nuclease domain